MRQQKHVAVPSPAYDKGTRTGMFPILAVKPRTPPGTPADVIGPNGVAVTSRAHQGDLLQTQGRRREERP